jgi:hypothetical protein
MSGKWDAPGGNCLGDDTPVLLQANLAARVGFGRELILLSVDVEVLLLASRRWRIDEVPVVWRNDAGCSGTS